MNSPSVSRLLVLACTSVALLTPLPALALKFDIQGETATLSGELDYPDIRRFRDAQAKGVKYFVLRDILGGEIESSFAVATEIESLQLTMVLDGPCYGSCPELLLAGKERRYIAANEEREPLVVIRSAGFTDPGMGAANITDVYTHFRPRIRDVVSNALMRKHTNGYSDTSALLIWPSAEGGAVFDCDDLENLRNSCKPVPGADAINAGFFTSAEPLTLPAAPAKP